VSSFGERSWEAANTICWPESAASREFFWQESYLAGDSALFFAQTSQDLFQSMAEPNEPKKETTRILVTPAPVGQPPDPNTKSRDTVRIQLPLREPSVGGSSEPQPDSKPGVKDMPAPQFFQPPPSASPSLSASVTPAPDLPSSGPTKETVRIPLSAVQTKKTQPLIAMPEMAPQNPSIAVAPVEKNLMPLLWLLLGVSAVILIIQIWTYLS
jgi:hypothetical protein